MNPDIYWYPNDRMAMSAIVEHLIKSVDRLEDTLAQRSKLRYAATNYVTNFLSATELVEDNDVPAMIAEIKRMKAALNDAGRGQIGWPANAPAPSSPAAPAPTPSAAPAPISPAAPAPSSSAAPAPSSPAAPAPISYAALFPISPAAPAPSSPAAPVPSPSAAPVPSPSAAPVPSPSAAPAPISPSSNGPSPSFYAALGPSPSFYAALRRDDGKYLWVVSLVQNSALVVGAYVELADAHRYAYKVMGHLSEYSKTSSQDEPFKYVGEIIWKCGSILIIIDKRPASMVGVIHDLVDVTPGTF